MEKIFKYGPIETIGEPTSLKMPVGAKLGRFHEQDRQLFIWATVFPTPDPQATRNILVAATGQEIPSGARYIDTAWVETNFGQIVWHLFDLGEE